MAERFAANAPPVVPSSFPAQQSRHALYPVPQIGVNANQYRNARAKHSQPPQPYQQQNQHVYPHHMQQQVGVVNTVPQHAQPLATAAGQNPQMPHRRASQHGYSYPHLNLQSPAQPQIHQPPQPFSAPSDHALRDRVVSLLASSANGCIKELGYPDLLAEHKHLQADYARLAEEYNALRTERDGLKRDNMRLTELFMTAQEEHKEEKQLTGKTTQDLNAQIKALQERINLLVKQCHLLQQANTLDAPAAYKILESKYLYALEIIKSHRKSVAPQVPVTDGENCSLSQAENMGNAMSQEDILDGGSSHRSTVPGEPQQLAQGSSTQPPRNLHSAPPVLSQEPAIPPLRVLTVPNPIRSTSLPAPSPAPISAPPIYQAFSALEPRSTNDSSSAPVQTCRQNQPQSTSTYIVSEQKQEVAFTSVATPKDSMSHATTEEEIVSHSASFVPSNSQQTPVGPTAHIDMSKECAALSSEGRPQLRVQTSFERPTLHLTPAPLGTIAARSGNDSGSAHITSRHISPAPSNSVSTNKERASQVPEAQSHLSPTKSATPSSPVILIPKDSHSMDVDDDRQVREMMADNKDVDVMMSENDDAGAKEAPAAADPSGDNLAPAQPINNIAEEEEVTEEEEMDWGDLTDVDDNEKRPVFDCICHIFDDDDNEERICMLCNLRLERENHPGPRPTFTDCSVRDLVLHAKSEHEVVWGKLRRFEA
ncbi:hypothetical protein A7U60_g8549 [Sanghuangporus baumii]|uniref:Uncharacterized protein n=1 Tax=Sanghuangporus baumii TaxID=108892 RepID=A0A9Q5HRB4_SANBA|nr:hypothetical protein A7U60_g8549 [Sanghuangporus baumii]